MLTMSNWYLHDIALHGIALSVKGKPPFSSHVILIITNKLLSVWGREDQSVRSFVGTVEWLKLIIKGTAGGRLSTGGYQPGGRFFHIARIIQSDRSSCCCHAFNSRQLKSHHDTGPEQLNMAKVANSMFLFFGILSFSQNVGWSQMLFESWANFIFEFPGAHLNSM